MASNNLQETNINKRDILDLFNEYLVDTFNLEDLELVRDINDDIIDIFFDDNQFKVELERALYKNLEKLTHKTFYLEGRPRTPSVRNWLSDFIKKNGSGMFDNVALTRYITYSENGLRLDDKEKKQLRKLLVLYRNLKFFSESMKEVPVKDWKIIPIEEVSEDMSKARSVSGPPRTEAEKEIDELKKEEEKYEAGGIERMAIEEEIEEEGKIEDLKIEANKYKEGSLERKAIFEEIRKMEDRVVLGKRS